MPFYMPTVDFNLLPEKHHAIMRELVHQDRLVVKPNFNCSDHAKMVHHLLMKVIYRDERWSAPLCHAWYMPHVTKKPPEDVLKDYSIEVDEIYHSGCFGSPQPVYMGDKQYLVTHENGITFILTVA